MGAAQNEYLGSPYFYTCNEATCSLLLRQPVRDNVFMPGGFLALNDLELKLESIRKACCEID